jgi:gamma-glutamyl-gamma-aminobutyrate hydrolase PuuD
MIVAVSMRLSGALGYNEERDAISHDWTNYLFKLGLIPILIPNTTKDHGAFIDAIGARHLLLTGGDSLGSLQAESTRPQPTIRDISETHCLEAALARKIPVLGVCRGLQLINVFLGGGLCRELPKLADGRSHSDGNHCVTLLEENREIEVNSYHNDGVLLSQLSSQLTPFAVSNGNVVEGAKNKALKLTAIQWHPERVSPSRDYDKKIIQDWVAS